MKLSTRITRTLDAALATWGREGKSPREEPEDATSVVISHLGGSVAALPIRSSAHEAYETPNLQRAIEAWLAVAGRSGRWIGVVMGDRPQTLQQIVSPSLRSKRYGELPTIGPVEHVETDLGDGERVACAKNALCLLRDEHGRPSVVYVRPSNPFAPGGQLSLEIIATTVADAESFFAFVRAYRRAHNVYRGRVLTLASTQWMGLAVSARRVPSLPRERIVLEESVLRSIERQTVELSAHAETLRGAGRHLRRGVLLYGSPGTGKTLTVMYLASRMEGRTVLVVTDRSYALLSAVCAMARSLAPATVILEDVDLVATARDQSEDSACNVALFQLLNEMDGLSEDADVLFVLTTNRPQKLEPALAARPGRIDSAIELPLPDADCRRRLLQLYSEGLLLEVDDLGAWVERTRGSSGAFLRELLRKAALAAAAERDAGTSAPLAVRDAHLADAMRDMLIGGPLAASILGATHLVRDSAAG